MKFESFRNLALSTAARLEESQRRKETSLGNPHGEGTQPNESSIQKRLDRLLVEVSQGRHNEPFLGVPHYGWLAVDLIRNLEEPVEAVTPENFLNHVYGVPHDPETTAKVGGALRMAHSKYGTLMAWSKKDDVDLFEDISSIYSRLHQIECLLLPEFYQRLSENDEPLFDPFNTRYKLDSLLARLEEVSSTINPKITELRNQWSANRLLILKLCPRAGSLYLKQKVLNLNEIQRRVSQMKCELLNLHSQWISDQKQIQAATAAFEQGQPDVAAAIEQKVVIRLWKDLECSTIRNWVLEQTKKVTDHFQKQALENYFLNPNSKFVSQSEESKIDRALNKLPAAVRNAVEGQILSAVRYAEDSTTRGILMFMGIFVSLCFFILFIGNEIGAYKRDVCARCGHPHGNLFRAIQRHLEKATKSR